MLVVTDRGLFGFAVFLYGVSTLYSVFLWRKGFQRDDRVNYLLLLAGFGFHITAMGQRGFSLQRCPVNNLFEAAMFVGWTIVATYLVVGLWPRLRFLGAFASPVLLSIGVFGLMPALDPPQGPTPQFVNIMPSLHAALSLLAYGAFGLAAVASTMFLTQAHDLKFNRLRALLSVLPPIQRLNTIITRLLLAGFVLLSLGLAAGGVYLAQHHPVEVKRLDPKIPWSILVWAVYFGLLILRWKVDRGGRRVAWGAIAVFVFVMLTFWGTTLLSPIHTPP